MQQLQTQWAPGYSATCDDKHVQECVYRVTQATAKQHSPLAIMVAVTKRV